MNCLLPHNGWEAREHQMRLWSYLQHEGGRRAVAIWHRRAGKDEVALHHSAIAAMLRPGNYAHCLPEYAQGRKAIWNAVNPHTGKRRIDEAFPHELRTHTQDQEMQVRLVNGSTWQVIGSDTYNTSLVGTSIAGIVFSEYALSNPSAWAYARPMIEENDGWAVFISTPRGHNHCKALFDYARIAPGWFAELLTARDTGALTSQQLDDALAEYVSLYGLDMGGAQFRQEYLCDWSAAVLGAFFATEMAAVRAEGRVIPVEPPPGARVHRSWDLGMRDDTSIWMFSPVGGQLYVYDCLSASGAGLEWWRDTIVKLYDERGWLHGTDYVPHDAKVRELGSGRTRVETMQALGLAPMLVPHATLQDGINAVRRTLPLCVFHPRCEVVGLSALEQYRREWDDEKKCFRVSPLHDWTSDCADSFRYLAMGWKQAPVREPQDKPLLTSGWYIPPPAEPRRGIRL
jgi:phage terminase large subunit